MFFSAAEFYDFANRDWWTGRDVEYVFGNKSRRSCAAYLKQVKDAIVNRENDAYINGTYGREGMAYIGKWIRPWDVVPAIKAFSPPTGDYGIGVEIEMGFHSDSDASFIANKIRNWKHIAIDIEGGDYPIECTFPPILYSKINSKSQPFRYLKLLRKEADRVVDHEPDDRVGTHINVSKGGINSFDSYSNNLFKVNEYLETLVNYYDEVLSENEMEKYFGRRPYGVIYDQGGYLEFKLFNSTTDAKALKRYINIAVSLVDLITGTEEVTEDSFIAALERGYNKR